MTTAEMTQDYTAVPVLKGPIHPQIFTAKLLYEHFGGELAEYDCQTIIPKVPKTLKDQIAAHIALCGARNIANLLHGDYPHTADGLIEYSYGLGLYLVHDNQRRRKPKWKRETKQ